MEDDDGHGKLHLLHILFGLPLLLMMAHVCLDVLLRQVFGIILPGTLEIVSFHYMVIAVFLPLALVELWRKSVAVDIVYLMLPRRAQLVLIALVLATTAAVYLGLAWRTWGDAMGAMRRGDFLMGGRLEVPTWQSRFALPLGFGSAGLVALWQLWGVLSGRDRDSWTQQGANTSAEVE
ncbi:MAG: TRAP transporter small permease [Rhodobacteraceae bacterium]|jgi:TRAP-type C4-dicarboxylate transport system permease small subunit|uniref:TRAP transporter small permease protein n=2 Tax=Alphaproteobacteria TaxID=28211 RepID=A0A1U7D9U5_9RHOB|nr:MULTISPECIES: TRAP transporter small permease [Salipiger]MAB07870.1 TRAP transporter small permease [Paracoccaceae bacterium]HAE47727.1 TRAP transporter small permease [Tistrella mobilis]APX24957.1 TRAP-type C4-dicarboxylate transport system, small permease component [Salipiger profundus]SFC94075.1 TRAP-type C4-dicarboxylate transport system, small permease component [Salipiger profundus]GFZ99165.1 hypothetical protein GCM10011326_08140 [Salipiger profundus]